MGPSILQTLLREPTRSYQDIYDPNRPSSPTSTSSRRGFSSQSSSRPSSIRSAGSSASAQGPTWANGQWEWSTFQGRKGLTGGTRSLYTPSVVGRSLGIGQQHQRGGAPSVRSAGGSVYNDGSEDGRSVRSATSADGSVRTTLSAPGGERRHKKKKLKEREVSAGDARAMGSGYDRAARGRSMSASSSTPALEARRSSRFDNAPPLPSSFSSHFGSGSPDQPSRRYSTAASPSRSFPTSPTLSAVSSPSRSKSPLRHLSSDDATPSLTSSSSSALSSEPRTPVHVAADMYPPPLPLDGDKPRKAKKSRSSKLVPTGEVQVVQPHVTSEPVVENIEPSAPRAVKEPSVDVPASPIPVPGRFYSVDEIFGTASPEPSASSPSPAPHPLAGASLPLPSPFLAASPAPPPLVRQESDNASFTTALDGAPPLAPAVPRLKLTRTESDQSRIGVRGSVEIEVDSEMADSAAHEEPVRQDAASMAGIQEEREDASVCEESEEETGESEYEEEEPAQVVTPTPLALQDGRVVSNDSLVHAAEPAPPILARFVEVKRSRSKRSSKPASPAKAAPQPVYEVVRSSKTAPSSVASSVSSYDPLLRPSSPAHSDVSASFAGSYTASTDVPDWLNRIRALGEPIQPLVVNTGPQPQRQLAPPPHWTVQQLRAQEGSGSSSGGRPGMPRPRSVKSLRARAKVLEGLPEDAEAEAEALAADEHDRSAQTFAAAPAWVRKNDVSPSGSIRTASPSVNGLSRTSSLANSVGSSSSGVSTQPSSRRTRSMDLDRERVQPLSPLSRSMSLSTSRAASSRASSTRGYEFDFEAIAAAAARPKGFSKLFQPPLASSKAVKPPTPVAVLNPRVATSVRTTSLRAVSPEPMRFYDENEDARSESGLSMMSVMSAPQLSPERPPKNPARGLGSGSGHLVTRSSFASHPQRARSQSPAGSIRSNIERSAPAFETFERPTPRALSKSFSAVEHPILQRPISTPPPPAPPITTAPPPEPVESPDISGAASLVPRARPVSSYLPPSANGLGMTSLAIARRFDGTQKTSRRFGLFRRSAVADSSASKRRFEPSLDLAYDSVDVATFRKRVRSDEVLVEVVAAGIDRWDRERAWQLARGTSGTGWVPGRAVVGKVLQVGESVSRVKKGEIVWGLSPLRKSGGLASLAILSRDHVCAAPTSLTPELSAALPAAATAAMLIVQSLCDSLPKGSKVLVLNAQTGIGLLCLQLAHHYRPGVSGSRDLWMVAQSSMSVVDGETTLREAGATDVLREEPLAAINGLHEGSFDVVIDTIGGRRLYDASRRILHNSGRFITTVGDDVGESDYNSSLRSLRRAFVRKDKKQIAYWRVDPDGDGREAVRDTLDKVREVVDAGALKPRVESVLPLSEARRTFDEREAEVEGVVVRVKEV